MSSHRGIQWVPLDPESPDAPTKMFDSLLAMNEEYGGAAQSVAKDHDGNPLIVCAVITSEDASIERPMGFAVKVNDVDDDGEPTLRIHMYEAL